jgi:hypothetical protein
MNRTKVFFYNSFTTAVYQVIFMIAGFITPKIMLESYGSEINGLISSINQFFIYFNLVEAGLSGAIIYALYKPLADRNHKAINGIVSAAKKFYFQAGYIFISLTIGLAIIYPMLVKTEAVSPFSIGLLVIILGFNGALEFFTLAKYRALLSADQKTYVISVASIAYIIVNTLIIVILAELKVDIVVLRFIALFSIILRSLILMLYMKLTYKYINYSEKPNSEALNKRWDALYLQILGAAQTGAPIIILTLINDLKVVSVYSIYFMVITGIYGLLGIIINGLSASFGNVMVRNEQHTLQKAYQEFEFIYYSLITIVYALTFLSIMPFIRIYTSGINDINYDLPLVGFLFVLNGLLYNIKTPQGMLVISAGLYKETKIQTTIQGAIAVLGGILLAPSFGIVGVLIASIISNIYRDLDLIFYIPKYVTKLSPRATLNRIVRMLICLVIITAPFTVISINPESYLSWLGITAVIGIYATLIVLLNSLIFDRVNCISAFNRIKLFLAK